MFYIGVDLGQAQDYTAMVVIEKVFLDAAEQHEYHVRHIERPPLGTTYPAIVSRIKGLQEAPALRGARLVVDKTGVGAAVIDSLREAGLAPVAITITSGDSVNSDNGGYRVPKRDLIATLQVLFQNRRLKIAAGLGEAETLVKELLNFKVRISLAGHDSYETWREGAHDDLVLATALACWYAEREVPTTLHVVEHRPPRLWAATGPLPPWERD